MTAEPEPWLPDCAFTGQTTLAPLASCSAEWSAAWLANETLEPDLNWNRGGIDAAFTPQATVNGFALFATPERRLRLASALLGRTLEARHLRTEYDRALLDKLVDRALADLTDRIRQSLSFTSSKLTQPAMRPDSIFRAALRTGNGLDVVHLVTSKSVLIEVARRRAARPRARNPIHSRARAIETQAVELSALVGHTSLSFHDLQELETGDVIALDDQANRPRDLFAGGRLCAKACVEIAANDGRLSLIIERAVNEW
ncbi:FliM/FliN family flagellar motor C-terminal domain-containing protein [Pelagerythrobacter marensis]|uniref:Flagellar motor switch protein FliN-like C-terminal domain-containing protein n=1 Tax=Pelagerythrobacter marensis TaxID=543877 RepID=A0A0G3XC39_9SPHN|nr:FliM/FliN family flagellar motor C-terminal domain-containing protein [Pelagerythrobacter marensis]AKM07973.1 hypothetical protein AM2010_1911 [Pelagerythrobacter marensis]